MPFSAGVMPLVSQFTEYQAITRRAFIPTLYVQIWNSSPTIAGLMQNAKTASGGISSITVPVQGQALTIPQWVGFDGGVTPPPNIQGIHPPAVHPKRVSSPRPHYGVGEGVHAG